MHRGGYPSRKGERAFVPACSAKQQGPVLPAAAENAVEASLHLGPKPKTHNPSQNANVSDIRHKSLMSCDCFFALIIYTREITGDGEDLPLSKRNARLWCIHFPQKLLVGLLIRCSSDTRHDRWGCSKPW